MKKNYIAHLQEYDSKTSFLNRQDKYRRRFIKTCYQLDKQNINPNVSQPRKNHLPQPEQKPKFKIKQQETLSDNVHADENKNCNRSPLQECTKETSKQIDGVHPIKQITINPYKCEFDINHNSQELFMVDSNGRKLICCEECSLNFLNRTIFFQKEPVDLQKTEQVRKYLEKMSQIKLKCIKLSRILSEKLKQQKQKCVSYYQILMQQLARQQREVLSCVTASFEKCQQQIHHINQGVDMQIDHFGRQFLSGQPEEEMLLTNRDRYHIPTHLQQIQVQIINIRYSQSFCSDLVEKLQQFDLLRLNEYSQIKKQKSRQVSLYDKSNSETRITPSSRYQQSGNQELQLLLCQQSINRGNCSRNMEKDHLNVSFELNQQFVLKSDFPLICELQEQEEGISPSFKHF